MPDQHYPVFTVDPPDEGGAAEHEQLGSKEKFWMIRDDQTRWLFKYPRPGTGEAWAEKVAAEIANLIDVNHAVVEFAKSGSQLGTITESFLAMGDHLFHGNVVLFNEIEGYEMFVRFGQRNHNVKNIFDAVYAWAHDYGLSNDRANQAVRDYASYIVFDGIIGNTDRHHENWGMMLTADSDYPYLAPSYDHASSLGRELTDGRRSQILERNGMLNYLLRGTGGVYVDTRRKQAPSPLRLAQLICRWQKDIGTFWAQRLHEVLDTAFYDAINKVPPKFMSDIAKEFAYKVVITSKAELLRSVE